LQLALSLGEWKQRVAGEALVKLAGRDYDDPMIRGALVSSLLPHMAAAATKLQSEPTLMDVVLRVALAEKNDAIILDVATSIICDAAKLDEKPLRTFQTLLRLLAANGISLEKVTAQHAAEVKWKNVADKKAKLIADLRTVVNDPNSPAFKRALVSSVLLGDPVEEAAAVAMLGSLIGAKDNSESFAELVSSLAQSNDVRVPDFFMQDWDTRTPAQRLLLLDALMSRETWAVGLLGQVKAGKITVSGIDAQRQARLLKHPSENVRQLAAAAFTSVANASRAKVVEAFQSALTLKGDPAAGKAVFATACAACHQLEGVGHVLGPDLRSVVGHEPSKLLSSILDPSANIEPGFTAYFCELKNGEQLYGIISGEVGESITFKLADATVRNILRREIVNLQSSKTSFMPDGLEAVFTQLSLANLIAYLKEAKVK
jgi:putative heme-binding domain-containing protein